MITFLTHLLNLNYEHVLQKFQVIHGKFTEVQEFPKMDKDVLKLTILVLLQPRNSQAILKGPRKVQCKGQKHV